MFWRNRSASSLNLDEVCFLDLETTGLSPSEGHRIIEYAVLRFKAHGHGEHVCEIISGLVNPEGRKSDAAAKRLHRISDGALKTRNVFATEIPGLLEFIGSRKVVAHYSRFEESFLQAEFERADEVMNLKFIDSIDLIKSEFPNLRSYSLASLCAKFQVDAKPTHRAEDDVVALYQLLDKVKKVKQAARSNESVR